MSYDHFFEANRNAWNLRTNAHKGSAFYDVETALCPLKSKN
jgi:hypothetical protein